MAWGEKDFGCWLSETAKWRPKLCELWHLQSVPLFQYGPPHAHECLKATPGQTDHTQTVKHAVLHSLFHSFSPSIDSSSKQGLLWKHHWPANTLHCLTMELKDALAFTAVANYLQLSRGFLLKTVATLDLSTRVEMQTECVLSLLQVMTTV